MADYRLTKAADADLLDLFTYGIANFGAAPATRYRDSLIHCFELLAENPRLGRKADELAPGARRHEHARHIIFYDERPGGVLITAVVHERSVRWLWSSQREED